jgi:hypothetical protein
VRVTTAFSRLVRLPGVWVKKVRFEPDRVIVEVALRRKKLVCPKCSYSTWARKDKRPVDSVWRHLDLGVWALEIHCRRRRLWCPQHGALTEAVPFAQAGAEFTRDFECLVAWLAAKVDKTTLKRMLRIDWDTVGRIVKRVCDQDLDPGRLDGLFEIGIETVSSYCTSSNEFLRSRLDSGGVCDQLAALGLDLIVEGDRQLALADASRLQLALVDPSVDDGVADVEALGEVVDADLADGQLRRRRDAVLPAHPADAVFGERAAAGGEPAGLVEVIGELLVGVGRAELADDLEHRLRAGAASRVGP